ncbi:MAG: polysaccharide pyruvyl transferase family protein [bacterium]
MLIHHFYPRTSNIGDHFVQRGIAAMIRRVVPEATFELLNVNSRGQQKTDYGLTQSAVQRANRWADLIIVGGSNLYEGAFGWPWGVHLDADALKNLRVPLFLLGIGTGSSFDATLHKPSARARAEIKLLNDYATLSGARDVTTIDWLSQLGVTKAKLMGDPATFIFNHPQRPSRTGHILVTIPPRRVWSGKRQFWRVHTRGRSTFRALAGTTEKLLADGHQVVVACNDPYDLPVARKLFAGSLSHPVICPKTAEEYFHLILTSRAVISGRLHTAVVAFSLGIPFLLIDIDGRTRGFIKTYELDQWAVIPSESIAARLTAQTTNLLQEGTSASWQSRIEKRDQMESVAMTLLKDALKPIMEKGVVASQ